MSIFQFVAKENAKRADAFIPLQVETLSRSECVRLIEEEKIRINGSVISKKQPICIGDVIEITIDPPKQIDIEAENIPLDILYQDHDIAVINKPQGMVVHPAHGNDTGTLVHAVMFHIRDLSGINGQLRPGIVHRLDKNTSGIIIIAKNDQAHLSLAEQFKSRSCEKLYLAVAEGVFREQEFCVENYIARSTANRKKMAVSDSGKFASTDFKVLEQYRDAALVECHLHTGRTHQIRVHLASIGHPCLGDAEYGFKRNRYSLAGQALHSYQLTIDHPATGERMTFTAPPPEYFQELIKKLQKS